MDDESYGSSQNFVYLDNELCLSNLLSILFLNKCVNKNDFRGFKNKELLQLNYSHKNIHSSTTIGHWVGITGHALGFYKCKGVLKLVDNNHIIDFNYDLFLEDYIHYKNQKDANLTLYKTYYGLAIYLNDIRYLYFYYKNRRTLFKIKLDENTTQIKIQSELEDFKNVSLNIEKTELDEIYTFKLNNNLKKQPIDVRQGITSYILENSLKKNDYELFDLYLKNYENKNNKLFLKNLIKKDELNLNFKFNNHLYILSTKFEAYLEFDKYNYFLEDLQNFEKFYDLLKEEYIRIFNEVNKKKKISNDFKTHPFFENIQEINNKDGGYNKYSFKIKYN